MSYTVHRRCIECGTAYSYESGGDDRCQVCVVNSTTPERCPLCVHVEDHTCEVVAPWNGAAGFDIGVVCATCGPLGNTGAMDASDARGVARRHEQWYRNHAATEHA